MKGFQVLPGVTEEDYREIKVMAQTTRTIVQLLSTDRITQLVLVPHVKTGKVLTSKERGESECGSLGIYWVQQIKQERPTMTLLIEGKMLSGLLDTGAHVLVIADKHWASKWPTAAALTELRAIGQTQGPLQRSKNITMDRS